MPIPPTSLTLIHHEIRLGTVTHVPRHLTHPLAEQIRQAIPASHHCRNVMPLEGTSLELFADLATAEDGIASFFISASTPLANGKIKVGDRLYTGGVACQLATAPLVWRYLLRSYCTVIASAPPLLSISAPGLMPKTLPWLCGFCSPESRHCSPVERDDLLTMVRLTGLALLVQCEQANGKAIAAGAEFPPDPGLFPELLEWNE